MHDRVAVPVVIRELGDIAPQVNPAGTVSVKLTEPVNPLMAVTVIADVADVPTVTPAGEVADIVKSEKLKVADVEWDSIPLVPVMVTT
jgi:hypothetical protein